MQSLYKLLPLKLDEFQQDNSVFLVFLLLKSSGQFLIKFRVESINSTIISSAKFPIGSDSKRDNLQRSKKIIKIIFLNYELERQWTLHYLYNWSPNFTKFASFCINNRLWQNFGFVVYFFDFFFFF